jgi:hypothetical protein
MYKLKIGYDRIGYVSLGKVRIGKSTISYEITNKCLKILQESHIASNREMIPMPEQAPLFLQVQKSNPTKLGLAYSQC